MGVNLPVRGTAMRVLVALLAVALSLLLRLALQGVVGPRTPFMTFYPTMMLAALCGGFLSGLLSTALMGLLAYFWVLPQLAPFVLGEAAWLALGLFLFSGVLASGIAEALDRTKARATKAEVQAAVAAERCALDAARRHLAAIVESSDDAILSATMDGAVTSWNKGAQRMYGYSAQEVLGRSAAMLCPVDHAGDIPGVLARVAAGESVPTFETIRQHKDGSLVDVSVTLSPLRGADGSLSGVSAVVRDITERKRAEEALRQSEERFREVVEGTDNLVTQVDASGRILYVNPVAGSVFGLEPEDCVGRMAFDFVHPDDLEHTRQAFGAWVAQKLSHASFENRQISLSGEVRYLSWTVDLHYGPDGALCAADSIAQDVTEKKRSEAALRESEAFSRTIIDNSPDCIKLLNQSGELTYMSPSGPHLLELESAEQMLGMAYLSFWKGSDHDRAAQAFHEAQAGRVGRFEGFCPTAGGTPKWWDVSIAPLNTGKESANRYLVISRDDTQRKLAADALRIERERLSAIIDTSPDLMFLKDPELRYLMANAAHETFLACPPRDMVGKTDFDLMPEELARSCQQTDLAALRQGSLLQDEKVGETWYRVSKRRVEDGWGTVLGVAAHITDVTASRNIYEALRESEELFRNLVESAPRAIFVQAGECFAYVNSACLTLYGAREPEDLLGSSLLERIHPDFHDQAHKRLHRVNAERLPLLPMEQRHLRLDGVGVDVEISAVPLLYGGKKGSLVFVQDITERKREEALRSDMERIAKHDLKGPLNAVINLPLLYQDNPNLTEDQADALRLIHQAGLSMLEQIDQSLTLYRIESGSFVLSPQAVDLAQLTRQVARELGTLAQALGVELRLTVDDGLAPISGDGLLCRTMFSNLLKNAVEASPRGGVVAVRLREAEGRAEWSAHNANTVAEALRESFFDKYSTHGKRHGAGLGTYSARLSAEAMGGSIAMRSQKDHGTTITVRLPLWQDAT